MIGFLRDRARRVSRAPATAEMPFLDHLEELRWRIIWSLAAVIIGTIVGLIVVTQINVMKLVIRPIEPLLDGDRLAYLSPADPFFVTLKLAVLLGFMLALPVVIYQFWNFFAPALHPKEKRVLVPAFYAGFVLFLIGVAVAYFLALPMTLQFMMGFQTESLQQNITIGPYASLVMTILIVFGLVFEIPVVLVALGALGLVNSRFLVEKRRYAIAATAIGASLITPGDMLTLTIFMMVPMMLLYEMSIVVIRVVERRRARSAAAEMEPEAI